MTVIRHAYTQWVVCQSLCQAVPAAFGDRTMMWIYICRWSRQLSQMGVASFFEVWQVNAKEKLFRMCLWYRCWYRIKTHHDRYQRYWRVMSIQYRYPSHPIFFHCGWRLTDAWLISRVIKTVTARLTTTALHWSRCQWPYGIKQGQHDNVT